MRLNLALTVALLAGGAAHASSALAAPPKFHGKVVLFGNLHAHSELSDDVHTNDGTMLPIEAFKYADANGLDFLAITDHHKAIDSNHRLFMEEVEYKGKLYDVALQYSNSRKGRFVAIPGIEWGNTATGNHLNVFGAAELPWDSIRDAEYDELYAWAKDNATFVQFNHPKSWSWKSNRNKNVGNFGIALYSDTESFVEAVRPSVRTISIITSVRGGHISGEHRQSTAKTHREAQWERLYQQYLNMGMHISPSANQDTHWTNWGTVTAARTAVWADKFDYDSVMAAFRANHVYATEDDEMVVYFRIEHGGNRYWMGDTVPLSAAEDDVTLLVRVWQADGSDGDPVQEGPYTVEILSDSDGTGGKEAAVWDTVKVKTKEFKEIPLSVVAGEYIYLRITEQGGRDNLIGEGEDAVNNSTGADAADGKRDDQNDMAWTSPIWFSGDGASTFVWSKNSGLYHDPRCWAVKNIGQANRRQGPAPAGKRRHDCPERLR